MQEFIIENYESTKEGCDHAIEHLEKELRKVRAGKANPAMLNGILVEYYGSPTPLNQVANVTAHDSKTLNIQPWEKKMLAPIEKAIFGANLGLTPQNDGENIYIRIPALTEDRRRDLVKHIKHLGEDTKVSLRTIRHKGLDFIKGMVKDGYPEDAGKREDGRIESMIKDYAHKVEDLINAKEKDIMKV